MKQAKKISRLPERPRILLIRLSAIGDVLHATSVAHNLKKFLPDCRLTWLVSPPADSLLRGNPEVDELLIWDRRPFDEAISGRHFVTAYHCLAEARRLLKEAGPFDAVLDIQGLFLTGILALLTGCPRRIGIHERHEGNPFFMTEMAPDIEEPHKIHRYLTALRPLGWEPDSFEPGLRLRLSPDAHDWAEEFWLAHDIDPNRPILMVNIRTTWPDKHLTPEQFAKTLALAGLSPEVQLVFPGAPADRKYIEECIKIYCQLTKLELRSGCEYAASTETGGAAPARKIANVAGATSLTELAALISTADLFFTCDTGPLYLAEAVGTPTLSLWGPTLPTIYGPLTPGHRFLITPHDCQACCSTRCKHGNNACMNAFEPEEIAHALQETWAQLHPLK